MWQACAQTGNLSTSPQHSHNFMFHPHQKATTWKAKPWGRLHAFVTGLSAIKTKLTATFCLFGPYFKIKKEKSKEKRGPLVFPSGLVSTLPVWSQRQAGVWTNPASNNALNSSVWELSIDIREGKRKKWR